MQEANWELILHRLDELTRKQLEFAKKHDFTQQQLSKVNSLETNVEEINVWKNKLQENVSISELKDIKDWKAKMDEIVSPKQLDNILKEHEKLKTFKTQATMIWVVVQVIMTLVLFWQKIFP